MNFQSLFIFTFISIYIHKYTHLYTPNISHLLTHLIAGPSSACSCHGSTLVSACSPEHLGRCPQMREHCGSPPSWVPAAPVPVHSCPLWGDQKPISHMELSHWDYQQKQRHPKKTNSLYILDFPLFSSIVGH